MKYHIENLDNHKEVCRKCTLGHGLDIGDFPLPLAENEDEEYAGTNTCYACGTKNVCFLIVPNAIAEIMKYNVALHKKLSL